MKKMYLIFAMLLIFSLSLVGCSNNEHIGKYIRDNDENGTLEFTENNAYIYYDLSDGMLWDFAFGYYEVEEDTLMLYLNFGEVDAFKDSVTSLGVTSPSDMLEYARKNISYYSKPENMRLIDKMEIKDDNLIGDEGTFIRIGD